MCQYNNIYSGSYKYFKEKKSTNERPKKKKKKNSVATVATVPLKQIKNTVAFTHLSNKCYNIFTNGRQKNCNYCSYNAAWNCSYYSKKENKVPDKSTVTATMLVQCKHNEYTVPKHYSDIAL